MGLFYKIKNIHAAAATDISPRWGYVFFGRCWHYVIPLPAVVAPLANNHNQGFNFVPDLL